jgi:hypothetical protein
MVATGIATVTALLQLMPSVGSAQETNERSARSDLLEFRLARDSTAEGYAEMKDGHGRSTYVSHRRLFTNEDVLAMRVRTGENGEYIELSLPPSAADVLTSSVRTSGATRLALVDGKRLEAVVGVDVESGRQPRLVGFPVGQAAPIARMLKKRAEPRRPPVLSVVPCKSIGKPGELFTFDVFVTDARNIKTYQITLEASGGLAGRFDRGGGTIDEAREDYLFSGAGQAVSAVDDLKGRFGSVLVRGSVDAAERKYLGTYTFRASDGALGSFTVTVRQTTDSLLADEQLAELPYRVEPATVTINPK